VGHPRALVGFLKFGDEAKGAELAKAHDPVMLHRELRDFFGLRIVGQMGPAGVERFLVNTAHLPLLQRKADGRLEVWDGGVHNLDARRRRPEDGAFHENEQQIEGEVSQGQQREGESGHQFHGAAIAMGMSAV